MGFCLQTLPDEFEAVLRVKCMEGQVSSAEFARGVKFWGK